MKIITIIKNPSLLGQKLKFLKKSIKYFFKKIFNKLNLLIFKMIRLYLINKKNMDDLNNNFYLLRSNLFLIFLISNFILIFSEIDNIAYCLSNEQLERIAQQQVDIIQRDISRLQKLAFLFKIKMHFFENILSFLSRLTRSNAVINNQSYNSLHGLCETYESELSSYYLNLSDEIDQQASEVQELRRTRQPFIGEVLPVPLEAFGSDPDFMNRITNFENNVGTPPLTANPNNNVLPLTRTNLAVFNVLNSAHVCRNLRVVAFEQRPNVFPRVYDRFREHHFSFRSDASDCSISENWSDIF